MSQDNLPKKILIVDDDPAIGNGLKSSLSSHGITVLSAHDLDTALYLFNQNLFDVMVVEQEFGFMPGLVLIQKWRRHQDTSRASTGVVLASGNRNFANASTEIALAREMGATEHIIKPFTVPQLLPVLARAYGLAKRINQVKETRSVIDKLAARPETFEKAVMMAKAKLNEYGHDALAMLLDLYGQAGRHGDALAVLDSFLEKEPSNLRLLNAKSRILLQMGEFSKSLQIMEEIDKLAPQNIERIDAMAEAYMKMDQPDKSVTKMKELIKLNADEPNLKFNMFERLSNNGFEKHAMDLCRETTNPMEVVRFYNNKGVALSKAGKVDEAISEYQRSLNFYPTFKENYRIFYNVALAHISKKTPESYEQAMAMVDKSLGLNGDFEKAANTKATLEKLLRQSGTKAEKTAPAKEAELKASATKNPEVKAVPSKGTEAKTAVAEAKTSEAKTDDEKKSGVTELKVSDKAESKSRGDDKEGPKLKKGDVA